jgi:arylsulfatase A-like enzyme
MMDDYYNHRRHGINYMRHNGREIDPDGHATDLFTQWACEYVERAAGEKETPFFLYLAYNAPHTPIQPPADWLEKVKAREPGIPDRRAKLVALIEHMDDGIGQVLKTLDLTGLSDRTLVVFASDNGGQVGVGANNGPTRAGKGTVYEGGIRVPAIVRWPGMVHPGTVSDLDLMTMDIAPTVLAAAGTEFCHPIDGLSFLPLLLGDDDSVPERVLYWRRREGGPFKGGDIDAVRKGAWKLLRPMPEEPLEMYYLENDPLEERNIIDEFGAVRDELTELLNRQIARYEQVHWQPPASANPE